MNEKTERKGRKKKKTREKGKKERKENKKETCYILRGLSLIKLIF
jgi:hypothetical protein